MSDLVPNAFQVPNVIVDVLMAELTEKEFKCLLLIIRKTRGWHKEFDAIAIAQFKKFTGINRDKTIYKTINYLIERGLVKAVKEPGKITLYGLSDRFNQGQIEQSEPMAPSATSGGEVIHNQWHLAPLAPSATGGTFDHQPVAPSATTTGGTRCHPTKDTKQNTNTKGACDRFIDNYPAKVGERDIRRKWKKLDKDLQLETNIDRIIDDINRRLQIDRKWIAGFYPDPINYLQGARWNDEIQPVRVTDSGKKPAWVSIPTLDEHLWPWAQNHGYSNPGQLNYAQYRKKLEQEVEGRILKAS